MGRSGKIILAFTQNNIIVEIKETKKMTIDVRGRIKIPSSFIRELDLKPGEEIYLILTSDKKIVITKDGLPQNSELEERVKELEEKYERLAKELGRLEFDFARYLRRLSKDETKYQQST
ncbi:AbrB/MazE/SpoVT family DNA-binding domain-containing protein [Sulfolobus acidocaldarius]|uniref:SpoVT-AbrB domain-containing protein n=4 Tax=Sulfolobus acidocaldarius TaxID=2285 RepID=Q4J8V8_SULAC|nr:AbrB/MazE/SpoVT family DNA-binding domain-containing protein [Sulfolobus acidocaldarius]AAY80772.1 hypothetical protein Saci_1448 [Sulfolobus acidocaldarius DSM 639]AGE71371.1 hypothetical protein SacN8_07035 [Sulfolobus acidocaldarius N8]AGE73642.1 hypothetical protein SacRon12I_07035 [Sulfolobus acidocaldarius Ron12/I]ALU30379.1 hypothetical protein ATY89_10795 [Sulfolobus acidocaldarius]ALU31099.1 hypothetical protein ATZ20_02350 [Sulfolobus acidocaldarius]